MNRFRFSFRRSSVPLLLIVLAFSQQLLAQTQPSPVFFNERVNQYALQEITFSLPIAVDNPYDPDEIAVDGLFSLPFGAEIRLPAFYCRSHDLVKNVDGSDSWRLRFVPAELGRYGFKIVYSYRKGPVQEIAAGEFESVPSKLAGFIRTAANPARFMFCDGRTFFPVGANRCWGDIQHFGTYLDDMDRLARTGANCIRVWMAPWWINLEPNAGRYDPVAAARLDAIMAEAEHVGLKVILCIEQHGNFEPEGAQVGLWKEHPYNAANGGPCRTTTEFFADETAQDLFRKRLRYIVGRWGYSTALLGWELFNEVELVQFDRGGFDENMDVVEEWHKTMSAFLRKNDPFGHLVTTSSHALMQRALLEAGALDMLQLHVYTNDNLAWFLRWQMFSFMKNLKAPLLVGEFGVFGETGEPDYVSRGIFAAALAGNGAGALPWLQDTTDLAPYYARLTAAADFFSGVAWEKEAFRNVTPCAVFAGPPRGAEYAFLENLDFMGLAGKTQTFVYIFPKRVVLKGASMQVGVRVVGLRDATYDMTIMDLTGGKRLLRKTVEVRDETISISSDHLLGDVVVKLSVRKSSGQ